MEVLLILLFMGSFTVRAKPLSDQSTENPLTEITEVVTSENKINDIDQYVGNLLDYISPEIPDEKKHTRDPLEYKQVLRHKPEFHITNGYNEKSELAEELIDTDKDILITVIRDYIRDRKDKQQSRYNKQEEQLNNEEYEDGYGERVYFDRTVVPQTARIACCTEKQNKKDTIQPLLSKSLKKVNEEPLKLPYHRVPRPFNKSTRNSEDDKSNNTNEKTDRENSNAGLNNATDGFKAPHENETSKEEHTDEDSEEYYDYELSDSDSKVIEEIKADLDKLLKTRVSKIVKLNDILKLIKDNLVRAFNIPPAFTCWERSLEYLMKDINTTYATYLLYSECSNLFEETDTNETNKLKKIRFDVKNREDVEHLLRGSLIYKHQLKPRKYWSSSDLIDGLIADDIFYKDMFEFDLPMYEKQNEEKKQIKTNTKLKRFYCENLASEQLLLAIETALVRFLLYPRCTQTEIDIIDKKEVDVDALNPIGEIEYLDDLPTQKNSQKSSEIDKVSSVDVNADDINNNKKKYDTTTSNSNNVTLEDEDYELDYIFKDNPDVMVLTFKNEVIAIPVFDVVSRKERPVGNGRSVKKIKGISKGLKSPFNINSVANIKRKLYAIDLSHYSKVVNLTVVEKILKAFFVKLPPVLKKVLDDLKPQIENIVDKKVTVKDLLTIIKEGFVKRKSNNSTVLWNSDTLKRKNENVAFKDLTKYRQSSLVADTNHPKVLADFKKVKEQLDMARNKNQINKSNFNSDQPYVKLENLNPENEYQATAKIETSYKYNDPIDSKITVSNKTDLLLHSTKYKNNTGNQKGSEGKLNVYVKSKSRRQRTSIIPSSNEEIEDDNHINIQHHKKSEMKNTMWPKINNYKI